VAELRISNLASGFVLYFETPEPRINAYALASTLVALADSAKAAGRTLNGAIDIEIVVEALSSGSFRAKVSAIARETGLFVKQQLVTGIVIGVLSAYIYDHTLAKKEHVQVQVNTDEVIITSGDDRVIIPREVQDATQLVARNSAFTRSIDRMLGSVVIDEHVTGFGLQSDESEHSGTLILPRELLATRDEALDLEAAPTRTIEEDSDLYIVKAIMERSKRKWEFRWHGVNISAPITDPNFYDDFARLNFTIAPGDEFQARLAIHQSRDDVSGVYKNTKYEVVRVYRHIPHPKSDRLPLAADR
jgi:hypothetical protein